MICNIKPQNLIILFIYENNLDLFHIFNFQIIFFKIVLKICPAKTTVLNLAKVFAFSKQHDVNILKTNYIIIIILQN